MDCVPQFMRMLGRRALSRFSSPTTRPGYILCNSSEELLCRADESKAESQLDQIKTLLHTKSQIPLSALPSLSLLKTFDEFKVLYRYYENQEMPMTADTIRRASAPNMLLSDLMVVAQKRFTESSTGHAKDTISLSDGDLMSLPAAQDLPDHIECANVLKKRRARMRRHKHKKRLRKNRFKNKK